MKGTVIFDFDYTLCDTTRLKEAMAKAAEAHGVPVAEFWKPYDEAHGDARNRDFDIDVLTRALCERHGCDPAGLRAALETVVDRSPEFVLPGAASLLRRLKSDGFSLVLFTHGNLSWQKRRAAKSGLLSLFDRAIFTTEEKEHSTELDGLRGPVVFVNDHGGEIDAMRERFPHWKMIALRGPKPRPSDPAVPVCERLEDVYKKIV